MSKIREFCEWLANWGFVISRANHLERGEARKKNLRQADKFEEHLRG